MRSILHSRMRVMRIDGTQMIEIVTRPAPQLLAEGVAQRVVEFVAGARGTGSRGHVENRNNTRFLDFSHDSDDCSSADETPGCGVFASENTRLSRVST